MIKIGDTVPASTLMEFSEVEGNGCSIGPNPVDVSKAWRFHANLLSQACARLRRQFCRTQSRRC